MKNVLITGVSSGIGYAMARLFVEKKHFVFGTVRNKEDALRLQKEWGSLFYPLILDITDYQKVQQAYKIVKEKVASNGLAALINNAGLALFGPMQHVSMDIIRKQFEINVFATINLTQVFLPLLGASKQSPYPKGRVITISSTAGVFTRPFLGPYSASKHAIEAFFDALRRELMMYNIPVVLIQPGIIKTPVWKKAHMQDRPYQDTDYDPIFEHFTEAIKKIEKIALPAEKVAECTYKAFLVKNPKARYLIAPYRFIIRLMMYGIPARLLDKYLYRKTKQLIKKKSF